MNIPLQEDFNFAAAVTDHGWWMLSPNEWDDQRHILSRPVRLRNQKKVLVRISKLEHHLQLEMESEAPLDDADQQDIKEQVAWMFRLDETFEPFYTMCSDFKELLLLPHTGRGRLLRSPTLFEDVVKVILTTNTRWGQTINMARNLVDQLGDTLPVNQQEYKIFPEPERILEAGEAFLKEQIRVGYRSTYIIDAAEKALDPAFDLESLTSSTDGLAKLLDIKGVGPYAFNTLSMILGKYDSLPVDSDYKAHVMMKYFNGEKVKGRKMESVYEKWGAYKFLAYWYDKDEGR
ncbi:hypothetical protein M3212_07280 [Alkalihalobacillus oceani]|uniref:DNA-3-methyladenine glycosylase family protein n=1 Tax=Halalkalibacter oceani TaxID=1653776 RepID=UPI00203CBA5A|nr:hypothetical protein [Halalkalibacter oceani]MCM3760589.1 hypothetical protein [Halalkalibacter oceani]